MLQRAGQTEAAVDLARLAGLNPAGVVCEIMNEDGTMARVPDLIPYCERHGIKMVTVADLIEYRRRTEKLVERMTTVRLPTAYGEFTAVAFREVADRQAPRRARQAARSTGEEDVLVRVHSECLTGDVFHSLRCDCGEQLEQALARIAGEERGVLLYMAQEGRGIGLLNKLKAYELQENGLDTVEANLELGFPPDAREYGIGSQILADLGLSTIRILTNNPRKITGIEGFGLKVVEQVPIEVPPNGENRRYLEAKRDKLGHRLHHQEQRFEPPGGRGGDATRTPARRRARRRTACACREGVGVIDGRRRTAPAGRSGSWSPLQRRDHVAAPRRRARRARGGGRRARPRSTSSRCPAPSSCRSARWRSRGRAGTPASIALGCVIRGETPHFDYVAGEAASGLQLAALETGDPGRLRRPHLRHARAGRGPRRRRAGQQGRRGGPLRARDGRRLRRSCARPRAARTSIAPARYTRPPMSKVCAVCGKGPVVRAQPEPLDGGDEAPLQPEPPAGPHPRERRRARRATSAPGA